MASALADIGHDVTVISVMDDSFAQDITVARRAVKEQSVFSPDGGIKEIGVLETSLNRSHTRLLLLELPPRPLVRLDENLVPDAGDLRAQMAWTIQLATATMGLVERLDLRPDLIHLHGEASAMAPFWHDEAGSDRSRRLVLSFYDPQREACFEAGRFFDSIGKEGLSTNDSETAAREAMRVADLVLLPSPGAKRQLLYSQRRLCLKAALESHPRVMGLMGGVDSDWWDPASDPVLAAHFDADHLEGKKECKRSLQRLARLAPRSDVPLAVACPGLVPEDGADQLLEALEALIDLDIQIVLLGKGPDSFAPGLSAVAGRNNERAAILPSDSRTTKQALAGADIVMAPAHWAPWGRLVQMGMRFGAVPVVHATGGLDDLVVDFDPRTRTGGGFKYRPLSIEGLISAMKRAREAFARPSWNEMCRANMTDTKTWRRAARQLEEQYQRLARTTQSDTASSDGSLVVPDEPARDEAQAREDPRAQGEPCLPDPVPDKP